MEGSHIDTSQTPAMAPDNEPSNEVSPLLRKSVQDKGKSELSKHGALSTHGMTKVRVIVAVGITWLGSFLAAVGTFSKAFHPPSSRC